MCLQLYQPIGMESDYSASCAGQYLLSGCLAALFVGSIYVWKPSNQRSTHPTVIKRRFISVSVATCISLGVVHYFVDPALTTNSSVLHLLGFRTQGFLNAILYPLGLTVALFAGPIVIDSLNGDGYTFQSLDKFDWQRVFKWKDVIWIRNYIFAPITEEIVFRACMLVLIINCTRPLTAALVCPIFFGAAHIHHMLEQVRFGVPWKNAVLISSFQFLYTTIFGAYSAYLFLRTGHIIAPIVVHAFCNAMGFPNFGSILDMSRKHQIISITTLIAGLAFWVYFLNALTDPSLMKNTLPWNSLI